MSPVLASFGGGSARGFGRAGLLGPLGAPTNLSSSSPTTGQVALNWTNGDATAQTQIYRGGTLVTTVSAGTTSFNNTGLANFTGYSYYVVHIKNNILSASSNTSSVTTLPAPPSNLSYTSTTNQLLLSWTTGDNNASTNIYKYGVYLNSVIAGAISYTDSGNPNTSYTYYITHERDGITSVASNTITAYTNPSAPTNPAIAVLSTSSIRVSWINAHSTNVVTEIYRNDVYITEVAAASGVSTYTDTGLSPATSYSYKVRHRSTLPSGFGSAFTTPVSATTLAPSGQQAYTTAGTYTFTVPAGVSSVSMLCVGGGQGGYRNGGGIGGSLAYLNNQSVSPGQNLTVVVGAAGTAGTTSVGGAGGISSVAETSGTIRVRANGGNNNVGNVGTAYQGGTAAANSAPGAGGGGAAGYSAGGGAGAVASSLGASGSGGSGGGGGRNSSTGGGGGGGVGILGAGSNGSGGSGGFGGGGGSDGANGGNGGSGVGGAGGAYGGGGAGGSSSGTGGAGGVGAVRIIWGTGRSYPNAASNV